MDTFEQGYELAKEEPDLILAEVWWRMPKVFSRNEQMDFVMGYMVMRRQRDDRQREQKSEQNQ